MAQIHGQDLSKRAWRVDGRKSSPSAIGPWESFVKNRLARLRVFGRDEKLRMPAIGSMSREAKLLNAIFGRICRALESS